MLLVLRSCSEWASRLGQSPLSCSRPLRAGQSGCHGMPCGRAHRAAGSRLFRSAHAFGQILAQYSTSVEELKQGAARAMRNQSTMLQAGTGVLAIFFALSLLATEAS